MLDDVQRTIVMSCKWFLGKAVLASLDQTAGHSMGVHSLARPRFEPPTLETNVGSRGPVRPFPMPARSVHIIILLPVRCYFRGESCSHMTPFPSGTP